MTTKAQAAQGVADYFAGLQTKAQAAQGVADYFAGGVTDIPAPAQTPISYIYTISPGGYGSGTSRVLYKNGKNYGTIQIPTSYKDRDREYLTSQGYGAIVSQESEAAQAAEDTKIKEESARAAASAAEQLRAKSVFLNSPTATWASVQDKVTAIQSTQAAIANLGTTIARDTSTIHTIPRTKANLAAKGTGTTSNKILLAAAAVIVLMVAVAYTIFKRGKKK